MKKLMLSPEFPQIVNPLIKWFNLGVMKSFTLICDDKFTEH